MIYKSSVSVDRVWWLQPKQQLATLTDIWQFSPSENAGPLALAYDYHQRLEEKCYDFSKTEQKCRTHGGHFLALSTKDLEISINP